MTKVFRHEIDISVLGILHAFNVHDAFIAVAMHAQDILVVDCTVVIDLKLHLRLVLGLFKRARAQDFENYKGTILVPILSEIDFSISAFINLLLDLVSLINHHGLGLDDGSVGLHYGSSWSLSCLV